MKKISLTSLFKKKSKKVDKIESFFEQSKKKKFEKRAEFYKKYDDMCDLAALTVKEASSVPEAFKKSLDSDYGEGFSDKLILAVKSLNRFSSELDKSIKELEAFRNGDDLNLKTLQDLKNKVLLKANSLESVEHSIVLDLGLDIEIAVAYYNKLTNNIIPVPNIDTWRNIL